jgi:hypothetical protein
MESFTLMHLDYDEIPDLLHCDPDLGRCLVLTSAGECAAAGGGCSIPIPPDAQLSTAMDLAGDGRHRIIFRDSVTGFLRSIPISRDPLFARPRREDVQADRIYECRIAGISRFAIAMSATCDELIAHEVDRVPVRIR